MRKIYVVGNSIEYTNWMQGELVDTMKDADLIVFTGGEDVNPDYYNSKLGKHTYINDNRDKYEISEFLKALSLGKKMCGICRGSQFLCVMSGGSLVQHQSHPSNIHKMFTYTNEIIDVSSSHHQAQYPFDLPKENYKILGYTKNLCNYHLNGNNTELNPEFEVEDCIYYKINALGIQSHPEWLYDSNYQITINYYQELLNKFMKDEL